MSICPTSREASSPGFVGVHPALRPWNESKEIAVKLLGKILGGAVGVVVGLIVVLVVASRFSDGPLVEMLPGGPFTSGEIVANPPSDWSFLAERPFVEFESAGRSRKSYVSVSKQK